MKPKTTWKKIVHGATVLLSVVIVIVMWLAFAYGFLIVFGLLDIY